MLRSITQFPCWQGLACLLLVGFLTLPVVADEEPGKDADGDQQAAHVEEGGDDKDHHDGATDHHEGDGHGDGHSSHDLAHNNGSDMIAAPHEASLDLAVFTLMVFIGLVLVLGFFAWGPILQGLKAREDSMEGKLKQAEEMHQQAEAQLAEYTRKLSEAQQEITHLRDDTIQAADEKAKQIIEASQRSAAAERDRAIREIEAAKSLAINELAQSSVNLAVDLAGQITSKELSADDHANLIRDAVSKLPSTN